MSPTRKDKEAQKRVDSHAEYNQKRRTSKGQVGEALEKIPRNEVFSQPEVGHIERYAHEIEYNPDLRIMCGWCAE